MKKENIDIEIDGIKLSANPGEMLIQVADREGIYIPRFCYHKKLKIAANCRMCLVEVENSPKTLPACATPVTPGMKAFTKSKATVKSQQAVMEFLLVNHPLDCPICDQGGECELQDVAVSHGADRSLFDSEKRVVSDEDLGSLVGTEMTRCIHCTRCIRFCEDIGGQKHLGAFGRGGDMNIGTYLERGLQGELSGNVIDLCPVGALTSKPFKYTGRSWEFQQHLSVSPHDCVGSNMYFHSFADSSDNGSKIMRVLPRENEDINEIWISDRDRFSYAGLNSTDRANSPMLKQNGKWKNVSWQTALNYVADSLKAIMDAKKSDQIGALISANSSCEELFLFQKLIRAIGSNNIDHRVTVNDFTDEGSFTTFPAMVKPIATFANSKLIILIGSNAREEQPLLFHKIRQAVQNGSSLFVINSYDYDFACSLSGKKIISSSEMLEFLVSVNHMLATNLSVGDISSQYAQDPEILDLVAKLKAANGSVEIIAGEQLESHIDAAKIRSWLYQLKVTLGGSLHHLTKGANAAGAWLTGAVSHRSEFMMPASKKGLNALEMLQEKLPVYFMHGQEAEYDFVDPNLAIDALKDADLVISSTSFVSDTMLDYADVILPTAAFSEFSGSFINCEGKLQRFNAAVMPPGEAKPAWKVYKVIANLLGIEELNYSHCSEITSILESSLANVSHDGFWDLIGPGYSDKSEICRIGHWPSVRADATVRRAEPLQKTLDENIACARINPKYAVELDIIDGAKVALQQADVQAKYICLHDDKVAYGNIYLSTGLDGNNNLGNAYGKITVVGVES